ncbi:acetyltransferase [Gammaproteobacteria bacterium]|nr:acetyltransferase [Gammaproteobacteria bacterium]
MNEKKLIIFGAGQIAELAYHYFSSDTEYSIHAFSVDKEYIESDDFFGLPVIAFEEIQASFPPEDYEMFIALSYSAVNSTRKKKYFAAKEKGYKLASYVSSRATILNDMSIGDNCFILENNTIQPFVSIGNNVTLWSGNHIGHHSSICDHVFIASHVVVSGGVHIGSQSFLGVNATIINNISIGDGCVIGAGALVHSNVESHLVIKCNASNSIFSTDELKKI